MIARYYQFMEAGVLDSLLIDVPEMEDFMLSRAEIRSLNDLRTQTLPLHKVTLNLQSKTITFAQMRALFDLVIVRNPTMNKYIAPNADIIHSPKFESALVKLSKGQAHTLDAEEKESVEKLKLLNAPSAIAIDDDPEDPADLFIKEAYRQLNSETCVSFVFFLISNRNIIAFSLQWIGINFLDLTLTLVWTSYLLDLLTLNLFFQSQMLFLIPGE
jgi:hypothetical protein